MSKKFVVLALCVVLVVGLFMFFTCGDDDTTLDDLDVEEDDGRSAVSLNFYIITDDRTTDDAVKQMQEAFNEISEQKYRTHVEFVLCTEAEYHKILEEKFTAIENGDVQAPGDVDTDKGTVDDIYYDENGRPTVKYPEIGEGQIDILLVTDMSMMNDYIQKNRVMNITELLNGEFKNLRSYINTNLYNGVMNSADNSWYSVPNNRVLGDYTYLLVNRTAAAQNYLYEEHFFTMYGERNDRIAINYDNVQKLVSAVSTNNKTSEDKLIPLYSGQTSGVAFEFPAVNFWTADNSPSVFTTFYDASSEAGDFVEIINPFLTDASADKSIFRPAADSYVAYLRLMSACREYGYTTVPDGMTLSTDMNISNMDGSEFAVAVVKGDYGIRNQFDENCYVMTLDAPRLEQEDMFQSMLAISSYTCDATRSMEIIADLTTSSELRNILQYGVEGTHFSTYEKEVEAGGATVTMVKRLEGCDYFMNLDHTGNAFMAYPCEDDGHTASIWVEGMKQNSEVLRVPTYGLTSDMLWSIVEEALIERQMAVQLHKLMDINETDLKTLDEYYVPALRTAISKDVFAAYYDKEGNMSGGPADEELKESLNSLVDAQVEKVLAQLREDATLAAQSTIAEAKELSVQYVERLLACETLEAFDAELEAIRQEMNESFVFTNTSTDNGTPLGMFTQSEKMVSADYSLAGALHNWWQATYQ